MLEFNLENIFAEITHYHPRLIALQFPEGLKTRSQEIAHAIEKRTHCPTITFIEPIFGACMLCDAEAQKLGADLLIHFGHTRFYKEQMPTIYVPVYYSISREENEKTAQIIGQELKKRNIQTIALVGTIQFQPALPIIQKALAQHEIQAAISEGRNVEKGQVLGCNYSAVEPALTNAQATVYIGDGRFHPLGIVLSTNKPVFTIEPFEKKFKEISNEKDRFIRQRMGIIASLEKAQRFAILVSTDKGQWGITKALEAKKIIEKNGKSAIILTGRLLKPDYTLGVQVDCFINTACPRIATDDVNNYPAPVISLAELPFILGTKKLEEFDSKRLL